jgi:hypothetical protein
MRGGKRKLFSLTRMAGEKAFDSGFRKGEAAVWIYMKSGKASGNILRK